MNYECGFCGQEHETRLITWLESATQVRECPNLPESWIVLGPDADGSLVINDLHAHGGESGSE